MNSNEEWIAEKGEVLYQHLMNQWTADAWADSAENLHRAAEVLFSMHKAPMAEDGEPITPENIRLDEPATLLFGYAMETAIKGCLIKKFDLNKKVKNLPRGFEEDDLKKLLPDGFKGHDLDKLFGQTDVKAVPDQRRLLKALAEIVIWAGKYPANFCFKKFRPDPKDDQRDLYARSIDQLERHSLNDLFSRLLKETRAKEKSD